MKHRARNAIPLAAFLLAFLCFFLACNEDSATGTPATELSFQPIADSLGKAGYDSLEIVVGKAAASESTYLYKGHLSATGTAVPQFTLPDSLGQNYHITVRATKSSVPGLIYAKVYTVIDGVIVNGIVTLTPGTGDPNSAAPTGVTILADFLALADGGDSAPLIAQVLPYPKANQQVQWSSSNPAVAAVDGFGLVRSGVVGQAKIIASAAANPAKSASIDVTVSTIQIVDSVAVDPHALRYFLGMPRVPIAVRMVPAGAPALVSWSSSDPAVATVSVDGKVTGMAVGEAVVRARYKGDATRADSCKVTVVRDPPVLNVGEDVSVAVGATVDFPILVTQEFGGIVEFKWTLVGDTNTYSTAGSVPTGLSHTYTAAGDYQAVFTARDLEGNVATAKRLVRVGSSGPLVVIDSPKDGAVLGATPVLVSYRVNNVPLTRSVGLLEGPNTITIDTLVNGSAGTASVKVTLNTKAPVVVISSPTEGVYTNKNIIAVAWSVDGQPQNIRLLDTLKAPGANAIIREYTNSAGLKGADTVKVNLDISPPAVVITSPTEGTITSKTSIPVVWSVDGKEQATVSDPLPADGDNFIVRSFTDSAGNKGSDTVKVIRNGNAPQVAITSPVSGTYSNKNTIAVAWTVDGQPQTTKLLDTLKTEGENIIKRTAVSSAGVEGSATATVILDTRIPVVAISSPTDGSITSKTSIAVVWTVDGKAQPTVSDALPIEGVNSIIRSFTDSAGNKGSDTVKVTRDGTAPGVVITSPVAGLVTNKTTLEVVWSVDGKVQTTKTTEALAVEGENSIIREFTDGAGNKASDTVKVIRDTKAPVVAITSPLANAKVTASPVAVAWTVDAMAQTTLTSETLSAGDGEKTITRTATDAAGNAATPVSVKVILDKDKPLAPVMNATGTTATPTNAATVTWKWTSGGNGNGTYRYWLGTPTMPANPTTVTVAQAAVASLAEGTHTLYAQESDAQGNWSPSGSHAIVVDRTAPTIAIDGGNQTVAVAAFTISAAVTDALSGVASAEVSGASAGNGAMTLASGKWTKAVTLKTGMNTLTVTAKDNAGNTKTGSVEITYTQPVVTITSPKAGFVTSNAAVTLSYTVGGIAKTFSPPAMTVTGDNAITTQESGAVNATIHIHYQPNVVFVRAAANGAQNGTNWDDAFTEISTAMLNSRARRSGNKLWISADAYDFTDVGEGIELPSGVSLYGGFATTGYPNSEAGRAANARTSLDRTGFSMSNISIISSTAPIVIDGFQIDVMEEATGINVSSATNVTIKNVDFKSSILTYLVSIWSSTVTLDNCKFNQLFDPYFILRISFGSSVTLRNSAINDNSLYKIFTLDNSSLNITGTSIQRNTAPEGTGDADGFPDLVRDATSTITIGSGNTIDAAMLNILRQ